MFKILLATDGSTYALRAAGYTAKLASKIGDAEVTVLNVKDLSIPAVGLMGEPGMEILPDSAVMQEGINNASTVALGNTRKVLEDAGIRPIVRAEWGKPADTICKVAKEDGFDLVIMGSSGMGQVSGILLGSVSDRVTHRSAVPVLIVRH